MPILEEQYRPPRSFPMLTRGPMMQQTPWGLLTAGGNQDAAQVSLSQPMGMLDRVFTGDVHAGLGPAGRYAGAGLLHPMFNPLGLNGSLGLGAAVDYNAGAGRFIPQAMARYATELGGGELGFAASATPDDGWGAFIDWSTSF